ncbi:hypothetical protein [Conexibacter sp. SYSU D00693]|uniref:hypothetical protein n=1 Tax=Conexibacter sp. SYSU D00693 TaxID=2812560 RepID=UPI00196B3EC8|nr:hypothetical protein [Conexibacter sp. SYSU D00693]
MTRFRLALATFVAAAAPAANAQAAGPAVVTQPVEEVRSSSVRVVAAVDHGGLPTTVQVEHGVPGAFDRTTPAQTVEPVGDGSAGEVVVFTVSGLAPATAYEARVVATNADGTASGAPVAYTTAAGEPPALSLRAGAPVAPKSAAVVATLDPRGQTTRWWVEHGPTARLGSRTAAGEVSGSGANETLTARLDGLQPGKAVFFAVVAVNATGETRTPVRSFAQPPGISRLHTLAPDAVAYGGRATVTTVVSALAPGGLEVLLQRFEGAAWGRLAAVTTDAAGRATFRTGPLVRPLVLHATVDAVPPFVSPARVVQVRPRVALRARAVGRRRVRLDATVTPAQEGQRAHVQRLVGRRWVDLGRKEVRAGRVRFVVGRAARRRVLRVTVVSSQLGWATGASPRRTVAGG